MEGGPGHSDPLRVLVVDDCLDTVESLSSLLGMWGFDTRIARDGACALKVADSYRPGVILLDLALPGIDGLEVVRRLRRERLRPRPLVVCMSGWGGEEVRRRCLEAGCDLHLLKPADPEKLRRLLVYLADASPEGGDGV
jgi:CheY-like chemotaxis protein